MHFIGSVILALGLLALWLGLTAVNIYGIYLCFKKKWYVGVAGLLVPWFAFVIGTAKYFFKKDLLA